MNRVWEVPQDEVWKVLLTQEEIIIFYIKRKLTTDIDIMTELDGNIWILNSIKRSEEYKNSELPYKPHCSLDFIKLNIQKSDFSKCDLNFLC